MDRTAQACIESAYNTSLLGYRYANYFGLKCGSAWKGPSVNLKTKEEYTPGQLTTIRDNFRAFLDEDGKPCMELGVKGYFDFISTKRYANLKNASTPREYLELIKKDGYATSSSYVNTNMNCISRYDLERFDWNKVEKNPYPEPITVIKEGRSGANVKWLQWELNRHGANLKIDGVFGPQTKLSVLLFQKDHGLTQDGIVGDKTKAALKKS